MTVGGNVWPRATENVQKREPRPFNVRGAVWIATYLLFILAPLFALLARCASADARFLDRVLGRASATPAWR